MFSCFYLLYQSHVFRFFGMFSGCVYNITVIGSFLVSSAFRRNGAAFWPRFCTFWLKIRFFRVYWLVRVCSFCSAVRSVDLVKTEALFLSLGFLVWLGFVCCWHLTVLLAVVVLWVSSLTVDFVVYDHDFFLHLLLSTHKDFCVNRRFLLWICYLISVNPWLV